MLMRISIGSSKMVFIWHDRGISRIEDMFSYISITLTACGKIAHG
jgi:hypothetical protein